MKQDELQKIRDLLGRVDQIDVRTSAIMWATARLFQALNSKGVLDDSEISAILNPKDAVPRDPKNYGNPETPAPFLEAHQECIRNLRDQILGSLEKPH